MTTYIFSPTTASNCKQFIGVYTEHGNFYPYVKGTVKTKEKIVFRVKAPRWMQEAWDDDYYVPKGTVEFENKGGRIFPVIKGQVVPNTSTFVFEADTYWSYQINKKEIRADGSSGQRSWDVREFHTYEPPKKKSVIFSRGTVVEYFTNVPQEIKEWAGFAQFREKYIAEAEKERMQSRIYRMQEVCRWRNKTRQIWNEEKSNFSFAHEIPSNFTWHNNSRIDTIDRYDIRQWGKTYKIVEGNIVFADFEQTKRDGVRHFRTVGEVFDQQIVSEGAPYEREFEWTKTDTDDSEDGFRKTVSYIRTVRKSRMVFDRVVKYTPKPEFVKYGIEEHTMTWYINAEK